MIIRIVANAAQQAEWLSRDITGNIPVEWSAGPAPLPGAAAIIDLLYPPTAYPESIYTYSGCLFFFNDVTGGQEIKPAHFFRINGWAGFLGGPLLETADTGSPFLQEAERLIASMNKKIEWVPDQPGFISARVLAGIINEAYFTYEEGVSSRDAIDTAMKLGTNYPAGPFEWAEKIGLKNIAALLNRLAEQAPRYKPSETLLKEVKQ